MDKSHNIIFKINFEGDLRRWSATAEGVSMEQLLDRATLLFSTPKDDTLLRYQDDEGDMITLANDDDLAEAISVASMKDSQKLMLRLEVVSPKPIRGGATPAATPRAPAEAEAHVQYLEEQTKRLEKEAAKAAKQAEKAAKYMEKEAAKAAKQAEKAAKKVEKEAAKQAAKACGGAVPSFMLTPAGAMLNQVITALTPRDQGSTEPVADAGEAMERLSHLVQHHVGNLESGLEAHAVAAEQAVRDAVSGTQPATHPGVTCDISGMCPIVGPRYKKKGANYDLCEAEFLKLTPEHQAFFVKIDHPGQIWKPQCQYGCRRLHTKPVKPQARFVEDVNIPENTEILPGTLFTKIWRLRNTGEEPWPNDTKLVCVGGDKFEGDTAADVSSPVEAGAEVDVAVSLVAPQMPGRYVSYWRLAEPPSMRKFGQRIWVQVVIVNKDGSVEFEASEEKEEPPVHIGVECDVSGMHPIVGPRYNKKGADYDLCEAEFLKLSEDDRAYFWRIDAPGADAVDMATGLVEQPHVLDELEARYGWSQSVATLVQRSRFSEVIEQLQQVLPSELFHGLVCTLEPLMSVPEKNMEQCLATAESILVSIPHDAEIDFDRLAEQVAAHTSAFSGNLEDALAWAVHTYGSPAEQVHDPMGPPFEGDMLDLLGNYVCTAHQGEDMNDWHFVTIAASEHGDHLTWTNRAEASWPLYPTEEKHMYRVGEECPYFETHDMVYAELTSQEGGPHRVTLRGPHSEPYVFTPVELVEEPRCIGDALGEMGMSSDDLSASMVADMAHTMTLPVEQEEGDLYDQPEPEAEEALMEAQEEQGTIEADAAFQLMGGGEEGKKAYDQVMGTPREERPAELRKLEAAKAAADAETLGFARWILDDPAEDLTLYEAEAIVRDHGDRYLERHGQSHERSEALEAATRREAGAQSTSFVQAMDNFAGQPQEPQSPWSINEALAQLGVGEQDLSASMIAEIQEAVSANTDAAEKAAQEESLRLQAEQEAQDKAAAEAAAAAKAANAAKAAAAAKAEAERLANEAQARQAEQEAAERTAAEEMAKAEAKRLADEAALVPEAKAAAEERARLDEAARLTAEADAKAAENAANLDSSYKPLVKDLVSMGFTDEASRNAIAATNGNMEEAANILIAAGDSAVAKAPVPVPVPEVTNHDVFPVDASAEVAAPEPEAEPEPTSPWNQEWDYLLEELAEMGFEDQDVNRELLAETNGNVKDAVKELVTRERTFRSEASSPRSVGPA